jgi:hypothetical protein
MIVTLYSVSIEGPHELEAGVIDLAREYYVEPSQGFIEEEAPNTDLNETSKQPPKLKPPPPTQSPTIRLKPRHRQQPQKPQEKKKHEISELAKQ